MLSYFNDHIYMDGTTSAVNYLLSPTSNDYYDHHSLQPIQSLGNLAYFQPEAVESLYEQHKNEFHSSPPYGYHSIPQQTSQQQPSYGYTPSIYDMQSTQSIVQDSNLLFLQNQPRLPPTYDPQPTSRAMSSNIPVSTRHLKKEMDDAPIPCEKNNVYEWMKGRSGTEIGRV